MEKFPIGCEVIVHDCFKFSAVVTDHRTNVFKRPIIEVLDEFGHKTVWYPEELELISVPAV